MHEFKEMIESKLDDMGRYYKNKEVKDITTTSLDAMCKMVDMLKDISTIEGMGEYIEHEYEMSGARGRDSRTGRYISRGMDRESGRISRHYMGSFGEDHRGHESGADEYMDRLEEIVRTTSDPTRREAARMLLKELEGSN